MTQRIPLSTAIHPSLVRPILLGGAEREPVLLNVLAILTLSLGMGPQLVTGLLAVLLGTLGHSALVMSAKHDPQMWAVHRRHLRYQAFYSARALVGAPTPAVLGFREGVR